MHSNLESEGEYLEHRLDEEHGGECHVEVGQSVIVQLVRALVRVAFTSRMKLDTKIRQLLSTFSDNTAFNSPSDNAKFKLLICQ